MFTRRMILSLIAVFALSIGSAFAGSGGTKKDATINVRNDSAVPIAVFVGTDAVTLGAALPPGASEAQVEAAGGFVLAPGASRSTKVVAGTHPVAASDAPKVVIQRASATIGKGKTLNYAYTGVGPNLAPY